jgi:hypothetical protein
MKHFIRFGKILTVQQKEIAEYKPHRIEYVENKLKYIKDRIIVDIINFDEDDERVFLELDNGYLMSEVAEQQCCSAPETGEDSLPCQAGNGG